MMGIEGVVALIIGAALGAFIMTLISKNRLQQLKQMQQEEINGFLNQQIELNKALAISNEKSDNLANRMDQLDRQLEKERELRHEAEKILVSRDSELINLKQRLEEEKKNLEAIQERSRVEFENVAHRILKQQTADFTITSQKGLQDILTPLRERIQDFEKKVDLTYEKGLKDQSDLKAELLKIYDLSVTLDKDAKNLTNALKSDSKRQGNWGEIILERVLERSGLIKDQEYYLQFSSKNEQGAIMRPDVVIRLPEDKHLVIDSKVSLTAYTEYVSAEEEPLRSKKLREHLDSIRRHIKELSEKRYDQLLGINSPDFVLMFMPVEPAFGLAVQADHELFNYAWHERVVIVSPTTLLATLRTVSSIWKFEKQNQNALEIADRGGKLYDKFASFVNDLENIGQNIEKAEKAYQEAHKKLISGSGNLIRQVEQIKIMGVTTKKSLPETLINEADE
ncbi:MAG: DNA recombination protein RmuC [Bacteroidetes bacterium HGW-Bacteroidetes-16]|jgi:DNA recombination protein RmuC|nr:MAG: DNA recombination protein RmuC [Bacteroidetes bacterium HGW-Bacteroidetes-16]